MPKYLKACELAQMFGVSLKFVYANKESFPGMFFIGKSYFWDEEMLLTGLKERALKPAKRNGGSLTGNRHNL